MKSSPKPATSTRSPAGGNVVNLTVHVNTKAKRRSKDLRDAIIQSAKERHADGNITGYMLLYVDEEGTLACDVELGDNHANYTFRNAADILLDMAALAASEAGALIEDEDDQHN